MRSAASGQSCVLFQNQGSGLAKARVPGTSAPINSHPQLTWTLFNNQLEMRLPRPKYSTLSLSTCAPSRLKKIKDLTHFHIEFARTESRRVWDCKRHEGRWRRDCGYGIGRGKLISGWNIKGRRKNTVTSLISSPATVSLFCEGQKCCRGNLKYAYRKGGEARREQRQVSAKKTKTRAEEEERRGQEVLFTSLSAGWNKPGLTCSDVPLGGTEKWGESKGPGVVWVVGGGPGLAWSRAGGWSRTGEEGWSDRETGRLKGGE